MSGQREAIHDRLMTGDFSKVENLWEIVCDLLQYAHCLEGRIDSLEDANKQLEERVRAVEGRLG